MTDVSSRSSSTWPFAVFRWKAFRSLWFMKIKHLFCVYRKYASIFSFTLAPGRYGSRYPLTICSLLWGKFMYPKNTRGAEFLTAQSKFVISWTSWIHEMPLFLHVRHTFRMRAPPTSISSSSASTKRKSLTLLESP